jgi:hypothetical protein
MALCPLCQVNILYSAQGLGLDVVACNAAITSHLQSHTLDEWVVCVQQLRGAQREHDANRDHLRRIPYWAMPRA